MKIDYLKKVTLEIETGNKSTLSSTSQLITKPLDLIFGVASGGLSPFEQAIHNKSAGDRLDVSVPAERASDFFGHVYNQLCTQLPLGIIPEMFNLSMRIVDVRKSDQSEIVKALAQSVGHGCGGGGCDCGCNGILHE